MTVNDTTSAIFDLPLRLWVSRVGAEVSLLDYDGRQLWLRWVEAGRCHYGEQRWTLLAAKRNGHCILSGLLIHRGELVFRPGERPMPSNADKMILPEEVERALAGHAPILT